MAKALEEILSCPFCPSLEVEICRTNKRACWVRCAGCGADAPSHPTRKGALKNWNTRTVCRIATVVDDDDADWNERHKFMGKKELVKR
ncbi:Lar family restriction alleviation protein [Methylobacter sp.]|uniref:Lar family restriction alleviation protein n=1 Tax=Methylobacter sp. TaxID=2051955 RepID=UPI0011F78A96|nr:Lar family restriction alleviation protein [Methylobacter sp.]TAK59498.1 MAG: hypothetical protein EPO18_20260 [Methylobacter sp.]